MSVMEMFQEGRRVEMVVNTRWFQNMLKFSIDSQKFGIPEKIRSRKKYN